jgi:hypothetical protein
MPENIHLKRLTHSRRARKVAVAALLVGLLAAGCGGSSNGQTAPNANGASASASTAAAGSGSAAASGYGSGPLAFAKCMRANGVPDFSDPAAGGGFDLNGIDPTSPAFRAAQTKCHSLWGQEAVGGPLPAFGSRTHASSQTLAKLRGIAVCMRQHGVPEFPDPRLSVPLHPFGSGTGVVTDYDGAILLFPSTLDIHAPAYTQAAAACGALAQKLGSGPHG